MVFFIVTNVEHDVIMNDTSSPAYDAYVGSTVGELGCWVDPSVTRIIQTGVEQSRIPDVGKYMQLGELKSMTLLRLQYVSFQILKALERSLPP